MVGLVGVVSPHALAAVRDPGAAAIGTDPANGYFWPAAANADHDRVA